MPGRSAVICGHTSQYASPVGTTKSNGCMTHFSRNRSACKNGLPSATPAPAAAASMLESYTQRKNVTINLTH
jgi:hypothetical protein